MSSDPFSRFSADSYIQFDPQQYNAYSYARNNPLYYVDPTGLWNEETGAVEYGDTLSEIKERINELYGTEYSVDEIAELNKIEDPNKIDIGDIIIPNYYTPDITNELDSLNSSAAALFEENDFGRWQYAGYFAPGGSGDLKSQFGIFCQQSSCGGQRHTSFVYNGMEVGGDVPGNIHYGYVGNSIGLSDLELVAAGAAVQSLTNTYNNTVKGTDRPYLTFDLRDNYYILIGYYLYDEKK